MVFIRMGQAFQRLQKTVYSDSKDAITTVYEDVKSTTPVIAKAVGDIAKGLKVTADAVWDIIVKQQKVWSICFLILTLGSILNWYIFYKRYIKINIITEGQTGITKSFKYVSNPNFDQEYHDKYKKYLNSDYSSERKYTEAIEFQKEIKVAIEEETILEPVISDSYPKFKYIHLIICLGLSGFSAYHFGDMVTGFMNPEYGAMKDILFVAMKFKQ